MSPVPERRDGAVLVFVYGTLKEGFPNFARNPGRRVGSDFRTRRPYPFYVVRLPGEERAPWLVDRPGEGLPVQGQVFEVDAATLARLDAFEEVGLPGGYQRIELELVALDDPAALPLRACAYVKAADQLVHCLAIEGPFEAYTPELAVGYRLDPA